MGDLIRAGRAGFQQPLGCRLRFAKLLAMMVSVTGLCTRTAAQSLQPSAEQLAGQLMALIEAHDGKVAVAVRHLTQDVGFEYQSDVPMPTASLIKFPLLVAAYQEMGTGRIALTDPIVLHAAEKVPGSGILAEHISDGVTLPFRDILRLMMVYSDNTATNLTIDHVGLKKTADLMESLGCPETKLNAKTYRRETSIFPERSTLYGLGSTTAADMVKLLGLLQERKLVSPDASQQMYELMLRCADHTKIAKYLPPGTKVANKSGEVSAARTDAALIDSPSGPIAICVLTNKNSDQRWADDNPAHLLCANIGKTVYDFFNPDTSAADNGQPKTLAEGSNGPLVEALQRTLNARSTPSPGLAADGDFGPGTLAALIAFQEANQLEATGTVTAETWQALGTLVAEVEVPEPATINSQSRKKSPADRFDGLPFVTCKGWVIGDAQTGEILWEGQSGERLHPASTTKIMTCYLVAELASRQPEVLNEIVTFSQRADNTAGSTAGVRAGEQLSVGELMYGLMLPSGNDASVALAEHFGERLGSAVDGDGFEKFVAAMNAMAKSLGMEKTHFVNTHGLTAEEHQTSAADLFRLSRQAMGLPLFSRLVATPIRGATVTGAEGYRRNLLWENTNQLLKVDGYEGIKTGTTNAAGACLVSQSTRHGRTLIVVVLGSAATDSRYADTRNLFGYAWNQLGLATAAR